MLRVLVKRRLRPKSPACRSPILREILLLVLDPDLITRRKVLLREETCIYYSYTL